MKKYYILGIFCVLLLSLGTAFAQPYITLDPLRVSYFRGETITLSGKVAGDPEVRDIAITASSPNGNLVFVNQVTLNDDGSFIENIPTSNSLWQSEGEYTISVMHQRHEARTSIYFTGSGKASLFTLPPSVFPLDIKYSKLDTEDTGLADYNAATNFARLKTTLSKSNDPIELLESIRSDLNRDMGFISSEISNMPRYNPDGTTSKEYLKLWMKSASTHRFFSDYVQTTLYYTNNGMSLDVAIAKVEEHAQQVINAHNSNVQQPTKTEQQVINKYNSNIHQGFQLSFIESSDFKNLAFNVLPGEEGHNPEIHVKSGDEVTIKAVNGGKSFHAFGIVTNPEDLSSIVWNSVIGTASNPLKPNQEGSVTFLAGAPGTYYYICTVPGHAMQGMKGKFIVEGIIKSESPSKEIPTWVKNTFKYWSDGLISDDELINAIQFLVKTNVIQVN